MNPGLVVKLRPAGPWRIGPDSGARNKVDAIYHSDSLYSAMTSALAKMGAIEEWLDATARSATPAVCFSSCFPFVDEIGFVAPPRTLWPPASPALRSARVRWKSARFVPIGVVQAILSGEALDENHWTVDGASECLMPAGRPGPFRASVRWAAAIDRLSGSSERHSTACLEFRPGAGLWTIVSFADDAAQSRWSDRIKAAFRWLADSGFGGERSRGWGRAETPEFVEGTLPTLILPLAQTQEPASQEKEAAAQPEEAASEGPAGPPEPSTPESPAPPTEPVGGEPLVANEPPPAQPATEPTGSDDTTVPADIESKSPEGPTPYPLPPTPDPLLSGPRPPASGPLPHWLLSVFTPAAEDSVDWGRGNYTLLTRGGRIESPAGSGELKKQVQMVSEGSVIYAAAPPRGSASDVAPEGFAHPVFRAGFAVSIPLPEAG